MKSADVVDQLARRLPGFDAAGDPEPLVGGRLNRVWRVPGRPASVIVKHAPPHVATAPQIPLDPDRILLEARCLQALGPGGVLSEVSEPSARPPRLLDVDAERHVMVLEDVGVCPDLGTWIGSGAADFPVAESLGRFVGRLHACSHARVDLAREFDNRPVQRTRHEVQYCAVGELAARAGRPDAGELGARAVGLGERFLAPGVCLTMGDLWPPSVLIADAGVRVIDWELAHFGSPAQDLGHLAAHLWMRAERAAVPVAAQQARAFQAAFLRAYHAALGPTRSMLLGGPTARDAAMHFGAEVLMRTLGPFARGYLYDGLPPTSPIIRAAVSLAAAHILAPEGTQLYANLCA